MSDAASDPSPSQNSTPTRATAYDDPVLETGQAKVAAKGGLLHHALRLARWLVRKFNELLIISLIAIPLGQLFLESQLKQQQQAARSEFLHNLVFVGWIVWVSVALVLALDNFQYLSRNKLNIVKTAIAFCALPTVDRFTTGKFSDSSAIYPICLVLAALCPERLRFPGAGGEHERRD